MIRIENGSLLTEKKAANFQPKHAR